MQSSIDDSAGEWTNSDRQVGNYIENTNIVLEKQLPRSRVVVAQAIELAVPTLSTLR